MADNTEITAPDLRNRDMKIDEQIVGFAEALINAGWMKIEEIPYFLERTYKWQPEFDLWTCLGRPTSENDGDRWAEFYDRLTDRVGPSHAQEMRRPAFYTEETQ